MYKFFYRLLQEIDGKTLVVVNGCLRTQNRNDLTYNCIRHFLAQTEHRLVFQYLPIIDGAEDFMTLFDFDTRSQWKRERFDTELISSAEIVIKPITAQFHLKPIVASTKAKLAYAKQKEELFSSLGAKDPHTLPRNLYLLAGKEKLQAVFDWVSYVGRNNRFKLPSLQTYKEDAYTQSPYTVFEFCHNHIDFNDFMCLSGQSEFDVLATDLKADQWYCDRYQQWAKELERVYSVLQQSQDRSGCSERTD